MNDTEVLAHLEELYDNGHLPQDGINWLALHCTREQAQRVVDKKVHDIERELGMI